MATATSERFLADRSAPLCSLNVAKSFAQLTKEEQLYAHYVGQASWAGARIIQGQWTPQAERLYDLLTLTFSDQSKAKIGDLKYLKSKAELSDAEWDDLLQYTSRLFSRRVPPI
jgi:dipeptidyl-peptidase III